jgi:hypothetical protein
MNEISWDALRDTLAMTPWLFGIYIVLELLENKTEPFITEKISHKTGVAPFLGALFGCIPQCGFSVIASALYTRRCISLGTLLAVFISTSDEAIPVILAQHDKIPLVLWILLVKVIIATVAGYVIDLIFRKNRPQEPHPSHDSVIPRGEHAHCCHAHHSGEPRWKTLLLFPVQHTLKISFFVFAVSLGIGLFIAKFGEANLEHVFFAHSFLQPLFAVMIGLIPNCAASVAITQMYLKGGISFGSAIAGLCAGGGLGMLVLLKEHKDRKETALIIGLLVLVSFTAGILLNLF